MTTEAKQRAAERDEKMAARGFVTVAEAARLVSMPRSNVYHWIKTGELRGEKWSPRLSYVLLDDLRRKVPGAFSPAPAKAPRQGGSAAPARPLRSVMRRAAAARKKQAG